MQRCRHTCSSVHALLAACLFVFAFSLLGAPAARAQEDAEANAKCEKQRMEKKGDTRIYYTYDVKWGEGQSLVPQKMREAKPNVIYYGLKDKPCDIPGKTKGRCADYKNCKTICVFKEGDGKRCSELGEPKEGEQKGSGKKPEGTKRKPSDDPLKPDKKPEPKIRKIQERPPGVKAPESEEKPKPKPKERSFLDSLREFVNGGKTEDGKSKPGGSSPLSRQVGPSSLGEPAPKPDAGGATDGAKPPLSQQVGPSSLPKPENTFDEGAAKPPKEEEDDTGLLGTWRKFLKRIGLGEDETRVPIPRPRPDDIDPPRPQAAPLPPSSLTPQQRIDETFAAIGYKPRYPLRSQDDTTPPTVRAPATPPTQSPQPPTSPSVPTPRPRPASAPQERSPAAPSPAPASAPASLPPECSSDTPWKCVNALGGSWPEVSRRIAGDLGCTPGSAGCNMAVLNTIRDAGRIPTGPIPRAVIENPYARAVNVYRGNSVADFLKNAGQPYSRSARKELAERIGIQGYTGSQRQNETLLKALREMGEGTREVVLVR